MNRRSFLTALAVTTACAVPGVAALVTRNGFERTLSKSLLDHATVKYVGFDTTQQRDALISLFEKHNELLRALPFEEVDGATYTYVREAKCPL